MSRMQFSYESSALDSSIMSEQSLNPPPASAKPRKIVMGRSKAQTTPSSTAGADHYRPLDALAPKTSGTASPFHGPNRFLTLNLQDDGRGAEEVQRQSALLMARMKVNRVPKVAVSFLLLATLSQG